MMITYDHNTIWFMKNWGTEHVKNKKYIRKMKLAKHAFAKTKQIIFLPYRFIIPFDPCCSMTGA